MIPPVRLQDFLTELEVILYSMVTRDFSQLRLAVLPVIKQIREECSKTFSDDAFSKHFWSDFKKKHPKIKEIWKNLAKTNDTFEEPIATGPTLDDISYIVQNKEHSIQACQTGNQYSKAAKGTTSFNDNQEYEEGSAEASQADDDNLSWTSVDETSNNIETVVINQAWNQDHDGEQEPSFRQSIESEDLFSASQAGKRTFQIEDPGFSEEWKSKQDFITRIINHLKSTIEKKEFSHKVGNSVQY